MSAVIISGKEISQKILDELKSEIDELKKSNINPSLAVIIVGNDPGSRAYVNGKKKDCAAIGIKSEEYTLPEDTTQEQLMDLVEVLNNRQDISGILVQLPLPKHFNEQQIIYKINPDKDVDAFHPVNVGRLMIGQPGFVSCTPAGVMEMIKEAGIKVEGRECVVVGRSNIVGKPMAILLLAQNGTVTICHSKTKNLSEFTKSADILIAAIGKPRFITADMVKPGAVVIDVGINRIAEKTLVGDVDFDEVSKVASAITPVPGGVGLMTRAMLMKNTVYAAKLAASK